MPSRYRIAIDDKVLKDLKKIDRPWQEKILQKIKSDLAEHPYRGKRLVGNFAPFWRMRVGAYRIIYSIHDEIVTVEVIKIGHRKEIYG